MPPSHTMGSLRPQTSNPSLRSPSDGGSSQTSTERYAVPTIPRWEELRQGESSTGLQRPALPLNLPSGFDRTHPDHAMIVRMATEASYEAAEAAVRLYERQRAEAEALQRQQIGYGVDSGRMRDGASPGGSMSTTGTQTQQTARSSSPRKPPQHKVYLINCKHCDLFLTDRGMKAVLLLKPNITLYSTDSIPSNCSPLYPANPFLGGHAPSGPPVERTCDCLTQTLGCHGCGAPIGYNIVAPCARCTSSVAKHQRGSNGHRTVLHCSEIRVRERRYVPGEPGVRASPIPPELWHVLEAQRKLELERAPLLRRSPSQHSESTVIDETAGGAAPVAEAGTPNSDGVEKPVSHSTDLYDERMRMIGMQKEALRSQLLTPGKHGRLIMRGQPVYWSDLVSGGERAEPFDADLMLDMPVAGR